MNLFRRISQIDLRKLTPTQIALGLLGIIVVLAVINFVLGLARALLPVAALALLAYLGYQWLNSRTPDKTVKATTVKADDAQATADAAASQADAVVDAQADEASQRLRVDQVVNPETGFKEADIARLEAEEKQRLADKQAQEDAIQAQLEERRRRLLGEDSE